MRHERDEETRYELSRRATVYSANWGGKTTHLMTEAMRNMEPDCDRYTICNRSLPDGERSYYSIDDHPAKNKPESYCPKCIAGIDKFKIDPEMLKDDLWWAAHRKYKEGVPYDLDEVYVYPAAIGLSQELLGVWKLWMAGKDFEKAGFSFKRQGGGLRFEMRLKGALAWTEERKALEKHAFISNLMIEAPGGFEAAKPIRLIDSYTHRWGVTFDDKLRFIYQRAEKRNWQANSCLSLSRSSKDSDLVVGLTERTHEDLLEARKASIQPADAGDPSNRWYAVARDFNAFAAACFVEGAKIHVRGEEDIPMSFIGVNCNKYDTGSVGVLYKSGGTKCGASVSGSLIAPMLKALKSRQYCMVEDQDGEPLSITISGRLPSEVGGKKLSDSKPKRGVTKSGPTNQDSKCGAQSEETISQAVLPAAVARALVFRSGQLGRGDDGRGAWDIRVELGGARSKVSRLWQEHRCVLEYLVGEAERHGRAITVPGVRIMTAMNMRFTKGSIEYGKAALTRLRDTVVEGYAGEVSDKEPTWHELRFIDSFNWRDDGGVEVVLSRSAYATYRPGATPVLRELLTKEDSDTWWMSWLAGFVADGKRASVSRTDIVKLAEAIGTRDIWEELIGVGSAGSGDDYKLWYEEDYYRAGSEADRGSWGLRSMAQSDGKAQERMKAEQARMKEYLRSGGFVQDGFNRVAWRLLSEDRLEIAPFDVSGLPQRDLDRR